MPTFALSVSEYPSSDLFPRHDSRLGTGAGIGLSRGECGGGLRLLERDTRRTRIQLIGPASGQVRASKRPSRRLHALTAAGVIGAITKAGLPAPLPRLERLQFADNVVGAFALRDLSAGGFVRIDRTLQTL